MKKLMVALVLSAAVAAPAYAFINPRTIATIKPDKRNPGYGLLHITVIGNAWKCIGRVKYPDEQLVAQNFKMQCTGWVKSAVGTVQPEGEFFSKVNYRLSNGIKGHVTLS